MDADVGWPMTWSKSLPPNFALTISVIAARDGVVIVDMLAMFF